MKDEYYTVSTSEITLPVLGMQHFDALDQVSHVLLGFCLVKRVFKTVGEVGTIVQQCNLSILMFMVVLV